MTVDKAQSESVTDRPLTAKRHTLYPMTLGHIKWLVARKNSAFLGKNVDLRAAVEICFALTNSSDDLQSIRDAKAKSMIEKFENNLTAEDFAKLQTHAENEVVKYSKTLAAPKKKAAGKPIKDTAPARKRSSSTRSAK